MKVFLDGRFVPRDEALISPDDRGFLLGDGVYEVIRAYAGSLFRADAHLDRMQRGLAELRIAPPPSDRILEVARTLLEENGHEDGDALVYIQVTRGVAPRRHAFPDEGTPPTLFLRSSPFVPASAQHERGIRAIRVPDVRWMRCDIKTIGLLPNVLASQQAKERGADEALFVRDGVVTEGAHTSFAAITDGTFVTHPLGPGILPSVTRGVVLELCRDLGIPVREEPVREEELPAATEAMVLSTSSEVTPVVRIDDAAVGAGEPGPVTRSLQRAFRELVAAEATAHGPRG